MFQNWLKNNIIIKNNSKMNLKNDSEINYIKKLLKLAIILLYSGRQLCEKLAMHQNIIFWLKNYSKMNLNSDSKMIYIDSLMIINDSYS